MKKELTKTFILFLIALSTLVVSVFAWLSTSRSNLISNIIGDVGNYKVDYHFKVRKNGSSSFVEIKTIDEMHVFFGNTLPNDQIDFRVEIENTGNTSVTIDLLIKNIYSEHENPMFNMLDVYYLKDGAFYIFDNLDYSSPIQIQDADIVMTPYEDIYNQEILNPITLFEDTQYEQTLNPYRFSNIVNLSSNLEILSNRVIQVGELVTVYFSIVYDQNTSHPYYTEGVFHLNKFYIYIK